MSPRPWTKAERARWAFRDFNPIWTAYCQFRKAETGGVAVWDMRRQRVVGVRSTYIQAGIFAAQYVKEQYGGKEDADDG